MPDRQARDKAHAAWLSALRGPLLRECVEHHPEFGVEEIHIPDDLEINHDNGVEDRGVSWIAGGGVWLKSVAILAQAHL